MVRTTQDLLEDLRVTTAQIASEQDECMKRAYTAYALFLSESLALKRRFAGKGKS